MIINICEITRIISRKQYEQQAFCLRVILSVELNLSFQYCFTENLESASVNESECNRRSKFFTLKNEPIVKKLRRMLFAILSVDATLRRGDRANIR